MQKRYTPGSVVRYNEAIYEIVDDEYNPDNDKRKVVKLKGENGNYSAIQLVNDKYKFTRRI